MIAADTPDALAFAHWYEASQEAQREVARLTAALDEAQRFAGHAYCTQEIGDLRADVKGLREILALACDERDDAERREKTRRFALRRELEEALGVGDSYADGALDAALARIKAMQGAEAEVTRLTAALDASIAREVKCGPPPTPFALSGTRTFRVGEQWVEFSGEEVRLFFVDEARVVVVKNDAARLEAERDRLRRELGEALAGREREYARAEAEHEAAARLVNAWRDATQQHDVCPHCWEPMAPEASECRACASSCTRCAAPAKTTEGGERLCFACAYADEADDDVRQMPGGAT